MAKIYPKFIDPDTKSRAERRLYDAFAHELDDEWVVFHNVKWLGKDHLGRPHDGEADFVVAHPKAGILVVEVKGGRIEFDSSTGHFISIDRNKNRHDIGDPFQQATTSKHVLIEKLRNSNGWPHRRILFGHVVAFPDAVVDANSSWLRPNAPRDIIIDALDLVSLKKRLCSAFTFWNQSNSHTAPNTLRGSDAIQVLERVLGHSAEIRHPLLAEHVRADDRALVTLTEKQSRFLRFLSGQRRAAIAGCAGSGKTFLALEKARGLAEEGYQVLFTCYNRPLADHIGETLGYRQKFDVFNFHQLCVHWANQAGQRLSYHEDASPEYFKTTLPNALWKTVEQLGSQYDAIIVDEGQDFRVEWWDVLSWLLHHPENDLLYVFFDDNQRLYKDRSAIPIKAAPFPLAENCRNTKRVFDVVGCFYSGVQMPIVLGPKGQPVEIVPANRGREGVTQLRRLLHRLINESGFKHDEIAVLSALGLQRSEVLGQSLGNFELSDSLPLSSNEVFATTIRRFKGLDRPVVVLCEVDGRMAADDAEALMYVGTSRAKSYLVVLMGQDAPPLVRDALTPLISSVDEVL